MKSQNTRDLFFFHKTKGHFGHYKIIWYINIKNLKYETALGFIIQWQLYEELKFKNKNIFHLNVKL